MDVWILLNILSELYKIIKYAYLFIIMISSIDAIFL